MYEGGDKFLEWLEDLGISFIVFYFGVGYVFIVLKDMLFYMENFIVYVVNKCLVLEEYY